MTIEQLFQKRVNEPENVDVHDKLNKILTEKLGDDTATAIMETEPGFLDYKYVMNEIQQQEWHEQDINDGIY